MTSEEAIRKVCTELADFLVQKNADYGDSVFNPIRAVSKASPIEQIKVRIDDKLSRLVRGSTAGEDTMKDLVGYWVILQVALERQTAEDHGDEPEEEAWRLSNLSAIGAKEKPARWGVRWVDGYGSDWLSIHGKVNEYFSKPDAEEEAYRYNRGCDPYSACTYSAKLLDEPEEKPERWVIRMETDHGKRVWSVGQPWVSKEGAESRSLELGRKYPDNTYAVEPLRPND